MEVIKDLKENYIGKQIEMLRKKQKIKQEDLCFGLCEQPVLSRIETGSIIPNYFLEVTLLSRLNYSTDKMEFILEEGDYNRFKDRKKIEQKIEEKEYEAVSFLLDEFEKKLKPEENLHWQFVFYYRAKIAFLENKYEQTLAYATKALKQTIPESAWINQKEEIPLSITEIELIAKIIEIKYILKQDSEFLFEEILKKLFSFTEKMIEEEKEKIMIFSSIAVQYAGILLKKKKYEQVVEVCDKGIAILKRNVRLSNYAELLLLKIEALRKLNINIELYKETFFMAYSMFGLFEEQKEKQKQIKNYMEGYRWEFTI